MFETDIQSNLEHRNYEYSYMTNISSFLSHIQEFTKCQNGLLSSEQENKSLGLFRILVLGESQSGKSQFILDFMHRGSYEEYVPLTSTQLITIYRKGRYFQSLNMDKIKEMDQKIYDVLHPVYLKKNSRSTSAFKGYIIPSVENNFEVIEFIDTPGMEDSPFVENYETSTYLNIERICDLVIVFFDAWSPTPPKQLFHLIQQLYGECPNKLLIIAGKIDNFGELEDRGMLCKTLESNINSHLKEGEEIGNKLLMYSKKEEKTYNQIVQVINRQLECYAINTQKLMIQNMQTQRQKISKEIILIKGNLGTHRVFQVIRNIIAVLFLIFVLVKLMFTTAAWGLEEPCVVIGTECSSMTTRDNLLSLFILFFLSLLIFFEYFCRLSKQGKENALKLEKLEGHYYLLGNYMNLCENLVLQ